MTLWYCPACGSMFRSDKRPVPCPNNECHAWLLLPCIKYHKDPLANSYEMDIEFMELFK